MSVQFERVMSERYMLEGLITVSVSFEERKKIIIEKLSKEDVIHVPALAQALNVSSETIRRDLDRLEKEGKLKKVYGGAVKVTSLIQEPSFEQKMQINPKEKEAISRTAASLVEDGDRIFIGGGTTPLSLIRYLEDKKNVTLITPSIPVMIHTLEIFHGHVIFIGGEVNREQQLVQGPLAEWTTKQIRANKAIISAGGVSLTDGITDFDLNQAHISRILIERSEMTIILADHSKMGQTTFAHICALQDVSIIVSDWRCSREWRSKLHTEGVELLLAEQQ